MEIKIQSTHFIKTSKPTPENLRHFKLSALDQLSPSSYISTVLYYKTSGQVDRRAELVKSLSEVLNLYYPLAGRITQDGLEVDCSHDDQGVKYLETQVSITLDDFLSQGPKAEHVGLLYGAPDLVTNALVTIQVNVFECGSLAIGVSASHKVSDAYNLFKFINGWASTNRTGCGDGAYGPSFDNLPSVFPPMEDAPTLELSAVPGDDHQPMIPTKIYVFNATAISNLRAKASENKRHSRVTLVTSLLWKVLISIDRVKSGISRDSFLAPAMTLRGKNVSRVSENSFGNVWTPYPIRFSQTGSEPKFEDLVTLIEDTTRNMMNWLPKASGEEICKHAKASYSEVIEESKQHKFCIITSCCRFAVYEADFGWGKPYWTSAVGQEHDMVILMDNKHGDGIEAWVSLNEKDMKLFEQDEDIIAFTSLLSGATI